MFTWLAFFYFILNKANNVDEKNVFLFSASQFKSKCGLLNTDKTMHPFCGNELKLFLSNHQIYLNFKSSTLLFLCFQLGTKVIKKRKMYRFRAWKKNSKESAKGWTKWSLTKFFEMFPNLHNFGASESTLFRHFQNS